jgi:hypothetical protein
MVRPIPDAEWAIGPDVPSTFLTVKTYVGTIHRLLGQKALVSRDSKGVRIAQFNDIRTGFGFGWWPFEDGDFR